MIVSSVPPVQIFGDVSPCPIAIDVLVLNDPYVWRRCGLLSNYFDHVFILLTSQNFRVLYSALPREELLYFIAPADKVVQLRVIRRRGVFGHDFAAYLEAGNGQRVTCVVFSERYMLSPVRLSSVRFVHLTQAVVIFRNISTALGTLPIR